MTDTHKVLHQQTPSAATLTDGYVAPTGSGVIVSSIVVCNRSATPTSFRIAIAPDGEADSNKHYIAYDTPIAGNDTVVLTLGITLNAADVIRNYATLATLSFSVFGVEITA